MAVNTFGVPLRSSGYNYNQATLYKKVFDFIIVFFWSRSSAVLSCSGESAYTSVETL